MNLESPDLLTLKLWWSNRRELISEVDTSYFGMVDEMDKRYGERFDEYSDFIKLLDDDTSLSLVGISVSHFFVPKFFKAFSYPVIRSMISVESVNADSDLMFIQEYYLSALESYEENNRYNDEECLSVSDMFHIIFSLKMVVNGSSHLKTDIREKILKIIESYPRASNQDYGREGRSDYNGL